MKPKYAFSIALLITALSIQASIIRVPEDYPAIQAALDASLSGDTIVVSPGTYFENINFRGKNVFLTSLFYLDSDTSYISSTVINGSNPVHPDTASCVIFNSGEDTTAVLQGFTITGGGGTKWTDIHGAGTYREGGGILVELSSPKILHNIIINNACSDLSGVVSAGGGGIRIGDGNPVISGNRVAFNLARYGAGIVLNYTGCRITNNVIASNSGGQEYLGGSGIWIYANLSGTQKIITNNTIVNNSSAIATGTGGISVWSAGNVIIKNNIIYSNIPALQIKTSGAVPVVSYSDVQFGYTGTGNIDEVPLFDPWSYLLDEDSPCADAGDEAAEYNDIGDPENPGFALFPSRGGLRNDIGAYGGPGAFLLPVFQTITGINDNHISPLNDLIFPNPSDGIFTIKGQGSLEICNISGELIHSAVLSANSTSIDLASRPNGIYFIKLHNEDKIQTAKALIIKQGPH